MTATLAPTAPPFTIGSTDRAHWLRYEPHLRRVIAHVHDHLDEPLDLNALAEVACLSPHHWHRIYHAMIGETLAQTVKRLRLHRAAGRLANSALPMSEIAQEAGYPSLPSFNRTFKAVYDVPPARYRAAGRHRAFEIGRAPPAARGFELAVTAFEPLPLLAIEHRGSYMGIGRAFDLLLTQASAAGLLRPGLRLFGIFFDDPSRVPEADLHAQAAVAGCAMPNEPGPLIRTALPPGPHAVLVHKGPYASMKAAYQWLYGDWLPRSGREPANGPVIEEYLNNPRDTAPNDLRTRIHLPLLARAPA